ncbi:MAG: extracellular solute-binding protein [Chloroflexi bacterium]|nr:extracellular solute-binding protein [Chloroflexota bacterium]
MLNRWTMRPVVLVLSLLTVLSLLASACVPAAQPTTTGPSAGKDTVTIEYWDWWVSQGKTIDREIELFQQKYPNIRIKKTTQVTDKYPELLPLAFKSGSAPDVFLVPEKPELKEQVKLGWLLPLNKWATAQWQQQFPPATFAEGSNVFDGKVYTLPYEGSAPWLQFYVNTRVFRDAGLVDGQGNAKLPKTWDDVREAARTITQKSGGKAYGYGFGNKQKFILPWQMLMVQNAGAPGGISGFDARTGKYTWASNKVYADWVKFFLGMKQDGSIIPTAMSMDDEMARAAFAEGKFGMLVGGVWIQSGWTKTHPDFKEYAVVDLPYQGQDRGSYFYRSPGGRGWGISAYTKHPEEAWLWFNWLNSRDAAERWVKDGNGLRVFPEVNRPDYAKTEQFKQFMKLQDSIKLGPAPELDHPEMAEVKIQPTQPDIQAVLEGAYTGQISDVEGALRDLEQRQNAALDRAIEDASGRGVKLDRSWWVIKDWNPLQDYATK